MSLLNEEGRAIAAERAGYAEPHAGGKRRRIFDSVITWLVLGAGGITMVFPLFWMISTSFKAESELYIFPPPLLPINWTWDNYPIAFRNVNYGRLLFNSVTVAIIVTCGRVITSTFAGFAFARLNFPGRDQLFLMYLGVLMVPFPVTMVPLYLLMRSLGWIDNLVAIILPLFVSAYNTFLVRQYMLTLPTELEDAARIDGASVPRIYASVVLPLCGPVIAAITVFSFLTSWNSFIWPLLVLSSPQNLTLPIGVALIATARAHYGGYTPWTMLMAVATASAIPMIIVYLLAQRHFVRGIALTGLKG